MRAIRLDRFGVYSELKLVHFPLEMAAGAQRFLDQDRPFGKVLLKVSREVQG
jgi:hypothetical protein